MTDLDTLEDEIKKALRTFSVSTSAGDFELRPTGEKLIVEQIMQALNLYIEGKEKAARYKGAVDCATWVMQHDESSFRAERAWFKVKPGLFLEYQANLLKELEK